MSRADTATGVNGGRFGTLLNAVSYDHWIWNDEFVANGGSLASPSARIVVKLDGARSPADVVAIFEFPAIWDLIVWVKPNPNGPFASKNPLVTP